MAKSPSSRPGRRGSDRGRRDRTGRKGPRQARPEPADTLERSSEARPPLIAIVGRPNVGKSTLLNRLAGSRIAIVEETPGVTRDRVTVICTVADRTVELVDTGGIGIVDRQGLDEAVEHQVGLAVERAVVVLFVVDAREGVAALDKRVARLLRPVSDRVIVLANKMEVQEAEWNLGELESLGFGPAMPISAKEGRGMEDLDDLLAERLPEGPTTARRLPPPELKLAFVGRMNAGKSSLVNALLEDERMIVSSVPGTTRDTVDVRFEHDGKAVVLIDTAGIRKERIVQDSVEFYAQRRAERAMRRADASVLVLDATADVARLDRRIAGYALDHYHPLVIAANKWDLKPPDVTAKAFRRYLTQILPGFRYSPVVFTSALESTGLAALLKTVWRLHEQASTRVSTAQVNKVLEEAQARRGPRPRHGKQGQIFYGTQVATNPPTFVFFCNDPELFDQSYLRYVENRFREHLPFAEVPLKFILKPRERSPSKNA